MINPDSALAAAFWERGAVEDCPVIDVHGHMGEWRSCYMPRADAAGMIRTMDECNCRFLLFAGHEAIHTLCLEHRLDIEAVRAHPDRLRAYFGLNGNAPDLQADYERFVAHPDVFVGVKTLPAYFHIPLADERYAPFFEHADAHGMPFLCHTWGAGGLCGIPEAEAFAAKYPRIPFFAGHSFHGAWKEAARVARDVPSIYLDLCAVLDDRGALEIFVEHAGAENCLFGTDLPWFDPHYNIGAILEADITDEDRRAILYRNAARILRPLPWFGEVWPYGEDDLP